MEEQLLTPVDQESVPGSKQHPHQHNKKSELILLLNIIKEKQEVSPWCIMAGTSIIIVHCALWLLLSPGAWLEHQQCQQY
jgi:hypothetical protein